MRTRSRKTDTGLAVADAGLMKSVSVEAGRTASIESPMQMRNGGRN
jgi:hypothetical protein